MEPVSNWRAVLRYAWSVRLMILAAILSGLEVVLQLLPMLGVELPIPPMTFAALSGLVTVAALFARFVAQDLGGKNGK